MAWAFLALPPKLGVCRGPKLTGQIALIATSYAFPVTAITRSVFLGARRYVSDDTPHIRRDIRCYVSAPHSGVLLENNTIADIRREHEDSCANQQT